MKKMLTKLFKWINDFLGKIPRWVLIIFFAALPTVLTILMVRFYFHTSLETFRPIIGNDNVYYWHEILTFNKVGLQGGYYSYLELTPKAGIFHFGPHGPIFEITYGLISKITGWGNATFLYIQMVLLGLGFIFFAWRTRLSQSQILLSGLAIITCWPVLTNTLMTLEENFHQAIGILLAGVLAGVISWQHKLPVWQKICLIILFIYIGWVRYTWVLFLIPTLILIFPKPNVISF